MVSGIQCARRFYIHAFACLGLYCKFIIYCYSFSHWRIFRRGAQSGGFVADRSGAGPFGRSYVQRRDGSVPPRRNHQVAGSGQSGGGGGDFFSFLLMTFGWTPIGGPMSEGSSRGSESFIPLASVTRRRARVMVLHSLAHAI